jgi:ketosteroid isomerase-like protein
MGDIESNKRVVSEFIEAVYAGDMERVAAVLAEDAHWHFHGRLPVCGDYGSRREILEDMLGREAMPLYEPGSLTVEVKSMIAEGDTVAVEWRGRGRSVKGGTYDNDYSFFFEVRDERITSLREYCDTLHVSDVLYA